MLQRFSLFAIFAFVLMMATPIFPQSPTIESGVPQTLAKWRAANYSDVRYKLNLTLEKGAPLMKGEIEIRVTLTDEGARNNLILDWRHPSFGNTEGKPFAYAYDVNSADESKVSTLFEKEHLIIPNSLLKKGENIVKIRFASPIKTSGGAITRYVDKEDNAEYFYSLFVPSDASTAFPVFDQPDLKARYQLSVWTSNEKNKDWKVISNGKLLVKKSSDFFRPLDLPLDQIGHWSATVYAFEETQPISTYVFAFAAGDFAEFEDQESSIPSKLYVRKSQIVKLRNADSRSAGIPARNERESANKSSASKTTLAGKDARTPGEEIFRLNREAVKYLESYFDYKFPFPKYDLILLPEFPFGGMEHAGATFLREDRIIFPTEPTKNDFVTRANLIFHEAAHQWFGDTVTMRWFDDLWLKEGFAEFMAYKTLEKVMPEYNSWKIFYERNKQAAYLTDSTRGTTPIYQEIPNLASAKSAYGNIVYRKAPSFLKQAEFYLGEDKFQTAVRAFLKKHQFANAEWTDLVKEFETYGGYDKGGLKQWSEKWVTKPGLPIIKLLEENGNFKCPLIHGKKFCPYGQKNALNRNDEWWMETRILVIHDGGEKDIVDSRLSKSKSYDELEAFPDTLMIPVGWDVQFIFVNYQDYGYGIFLLDEKSRDYVQKNIQNEQDDFLRTMMWGSLWDSVRETELAPQDYVALVIKNLALSPAFTRQNAETNSTKSKTQNVNEKPPEGGTQNIVETDESTIQTLLNRVSTAMNYYLSDKQREELAPNIEAVLIEKMSKAETLGQRITFYRAFLNIASTEKAKQTLKEILNSKFQISDFKLKTKDKFDIVTKLLILGDKDAPQILTELEKTETTDEAKRYAYAAKAGIVTTENKAKFYNDFTGNKELSESWIEAAFTPFNSPKYADLTLPYLEKALTELPTLKRNRKIFFVNGWLAAFIGGQKSAQALAIVNKFLADNPNLDKDLRLKILENADGLERAVKIRAKHGN